MPYFDVFSSQTDDIVKDEAPLTDLPTNIAAGTARICSPPAPPASSPPSSPAPTSSPPSSPPVTAVKPHTDSYASASKSVEENPSRGAEAEQSFDEPNKSGASCPLQDAGEKSAPASECGSFLVLESAPDSHKFKLTMLQPSRPVQFYRAVKNEMRLLQSSLPPGIWVRGYQDRMDLYSVMIRGPSKTPYQDGLFFFDFQLSSDYPQTPPLCNYITYCSDKLNPNLYEDGKVCISLLGTWSGKGTEVWTQKSNLLQVIISIQGLILVSEPYFNEAYYERQKGSQQGHENSRMYNEMVLLKLIQATSRMLQQPPDVFKEEILEHYNTHAMHLVGRLERWQQISEAHNKAHPLSPTTPNTYRSIVKDAEQQCSLPEFPLIPASKGFCLTLRSTLPQVRAVLDRVLAPDWLRQVLVPDCVGQDSQTSTRETSSSVANQTALSIDADVYLDSGCGSVVDSNNTSNQATLDTSCSLTSTLSAKSINSEDQNDIESFESS